MTVYNSKTTKCLFTDYEWSCGLILPVIVTDGELLVLLSAEDINLIVFVSGPPILTMAGDNPFAIANISLL